MHAGPLGTFAGSSVPQPGWQSRPAERKGVIMSSSAAAGNDRVDLSEATRQLQQAEHDARVAFDCIGLDELDRAHTHAIPARAAMDAAETLLRAALAERSMVSGVG